MPNKRERWGGRKSVGKSWELSLLLRGKKREKETKKKRLAGPVSCPAEQVFATQVRTSQVCIVMQGGLGNPAMGDPVMYTYVTPRKRGR